MVGKRRRAAAKLKSQPAADETTETAADSGAESRSPSPQRRADGASRSPSNRPSAQHELWFEEPAAVDRSEDLLNWEAAAAATPAMSSGVTDERLIITKIVTENFKSYHGRHVLGPFHKNFTAILGPNGSGKSNVIDALLFVFGFRATQIRSTKVSSLIHASAAHLDVSSCKVEVFFAKIIDRQENGAEDFEMVPGSEFFVSRTATKNGASNYHINGRPAKTDDVHARLTANGVDLDHNRFLILQGEVEQIALMKPKGDERLGTEGMLEYLEDIIGSSRFKEPIVRLKKKLEFYGQEEDLLKKRLDVADTDVECLIEPVYAVLSMMKLENARTKTEHKLLSLRRANLERRYKDADALCEQKEAVINETQRQQTKLEAELKAAKKQKADMQKKSDRAKQDIEDANQKDRRLDNECRKTTQRIAALEQKIQTKEAEVERDREKLEAARNGPERAQRLLAVLQAAIEQKQTEIAELEVEMRELRKREREENAENRRQLGEIMPQVAEMKAEEDQCLSDIAPIKDKLERLQNAGTNLQQRCDTAEARCAKVGEDVERTRSELQALAEKIPDLRKQLTEGEAEMRAIRERGHTLFREYNRLNSELHFHLNKAEGRRTQSNALMALTQAHANGKLDGLLGRLGDLGGIDGRYDVAISTCCRALNDIVVETVECAQKCIQFLKQRGLPRMTFIALDRQRHFWKDIRNRPEIPAGSQRLFDLIAVTDEKLKPAFYSALHDTLVVDTIQTATNIAHFDDQRWRVVTLRGHVIEMNGLMTGGGRWEKRGLMGKRARVDMSHRTSPQELKQMEAQLEKKRAELYALRSELYAKTDELRTLKEELDHVVHKQRFCSQRLTVVQNQKKEAEKQLKRAQQALQATDVDGNAIRDLRDRVNQIERRKESIGQRSAQVLKEKDELEAKIRAVEDRLLGASQLALKKLKSELKAAEESLSKKKLVITNSGANIRKLELGITRAERAVEDARWELDAARESIDRQQAAKQENVERKNELEQSLVQLTEELGNQTVKIEELVAQIEALQRKVREHKAAIEEAVDERAELSDKLNRVSADMGKLTMLQVRQDIVSFLEAEMNKRREDAPADAQADATADAAVEGPVDAPAESSGAGDGGTAVAETTAGSELGFRVDTSALPPPADEAADSNQTRATTRRRITEAAGAFDLGELAEEGDLPNTTPVTNDRGEITYDPPFDSAPLPLYSPAELDTFNKEQLTKRLKKLQAKQKRFGQPMNLQMVNDFGEKMDKRNLVTAKMQELIAKKNDHRRVFDRLSRQRSDEFMAGFQKIRVATQEIYQMLTLGGDAALETVDRLDPFRDGVAFQVRPPKKTWKQITNLSGGEKTLASLSLVFGLHDFRPTPLYVMDEIDAALDYRNVSIIATFLKERTKNAQFIIISLRNNMFEHADRWIGIFKVADCTYSVALDPNGLTVDPTEDDGSESSDDDLDKLEKEQLAREQEQRAKRRQSSTVGTSPVRKRRR